MNTGIVVYSYDGHALSAATKLQAKLVARGHQVTLDRLETVEPLQMGNTTATLRALPAVDGHDALALPAPCEENARATDVWYSWKRSRRPRQDQRFCSRGHALRMRAPADA